MSYADWVRKNCKFAQVNQATGMEQIVRNLAQKLVPVSQKFPISAADVRLQATKFMRGNGLQMPQGGDMETFVQSVMDAIQGMGGNVASAAPQAPAAPSTPFDPRSEMRKEKAPMDPAMQNWYNNEKMQKEVKPTQPGMRSLKAPFPG
jgi:hypothetical protein